MNSLETLKENTAKDAVLSDVAHVLAQRKRTRDSITMVGLVQKMKVEGFKHKRAEYARVLKTLSSLGLGKLQVNNGNVKALKHVTMPLQSIGMAALGQKGDKQKEVRKRGRKVYSNKRSSKGVNIVGITIEINGRPIGLSLQTNTSMVEVAEIISRLQKTA